MHKARFLVAIVMIMCCAMASAGAAHAQQACVFGSTIGEGSGSAFESPFPECFGPTEVAEVQASNSHWLLRTASGEVYARGNGGSGQLGQGSYASSNEWLKVPLPCTATAIGQFRNSSVAGCSGRWFAWGEDSSYAACIKATIDSLTTPTEITSLNFWKPVAESGGGAHSMWLTASGQVLVCGNADQAGLGGKAPRQTPTPVPTGPVPVVEINGSGSAVVRLANGEVEAWGNNELGQTCTGSSLVLVETPTHVPLPGSAEEAKSGGDNLSNGSGSFLVEGQMYSCGYGGKGKLGTGNEANQSLPTPTGLHYAHIVVGGAATFGITAEGELQGVGNGAHSMLGIGSAGGTHLTPVHIQNGVLGFSSVAQASVSIH